MHETKPTRIYSLKLYNIYVVYDICNEERRRWTSPTGTNGGTRPLAFCSAVLGSGEGLTAGREWTDFGRKGEEISSLSGSGCMCGSSVATARHRTQTPLFFIIEHFWTFHQQQQSGEWRSASRQHFATRVFRRDSEWFARELQSLGLGCCL